MAEKYQARSNNGKMDEKKIQEERNIKNNANTINNAADVAIASKHPYAVAAGLAVKGLDKITNGKSTEMLSKGVTKTLKYNPMGKQIQQTSNTLAESGAGNAIGKAASLKSGNTQLGQTGTNSNSGASSKPNSLKPTDNTSNNNATNTDNKSSLLGDLSKDGIGKMLFKSVGKKYVIIACAGFFVFLILMTAVVSAKDFGNLELTNNTSSIVSHRGSSSVANLSEGLETVANWYIENVKIYSQETYFDSPFPLGKVRADCTGFTAAYMSYVAGESIRTSYSLEMLYTNGEWANEVGELGWKAYSSDEIGKLQFGDVLVADNRALYSTKGQHAEVYIDESHTFGWGSVKTSYPTNNTISTSTEGGHVHFRDGGHDYITVYRYEGTFSSNSSLNATMMNDSSFNHGTKDKNNQKYIMLHDTEMSASATDTVNSWKNSGNGVAAHFVIDKDGTIIQAVDLDVIAHHAGPGGPGNYDAKFGVGNNDGKGSGDDLVGNPTGTGNYANYTSYGMNSYSIGIEMCHLNGESYPEEQLNALDKVIEYIDSYYGFESTIIDHKEWRPSNSDTDTNFATYLNNYKTLRHH